MDSPKPGNRSMDNGVAARFSWKFTEDISCAPVEVYQKRARYRSRQRVFAVRQEYRSASRQEIAQRPAKTETAVVVRINARWRNRMRVCSRVRRCLNALEFTAMVVCPKCGKCKWKCIHKDAIDPSADKYLCLECGEKFRRYDGTKHEQKGREANKPE